MPDERTLTLDKVYEARGELYAIQDELKFIKGQLARIPSRAEVMRLTVGAIFGVAGLVILWIELFLR